MVADTSGMRFVVCDGDQLLRSMIEAIIERNGHEVVGVADQTAIATQLVVHSKPDAVVIDLSLGYNTDFDVLEAVDAVGAVAIVFSHNADHELLARRTMQPTVVPKPDLVELERVIASLAIRMTVSDAPPTDRRIHEPRAARGRVPAGLDDVDAFYEAMGAIEQGDVLLSIEPADAAPIAAIVRGSDRVVATGSSVKVLLAGASSVGLEAFLGRLRDRVPDIASTATIRSALVGPGETSADAYDRLRGATPAS